MAHYDYLIQNRHINSDAFKSNSSGIISEFCSTFKYCRFICLAGSCRPTQELQANCRVIPVEITRIYGYDGPWRVGSWLVRRMRPFNSLIIEALEQNSGNKSLSKELISEAMDTE